MVSNKLDKISLLSIHSTAVDLVGAPKGSAVELIDYREGPLVSMIILNCPQCGRPITIGGQFSNFNIPIKLFRVPRRLTIKDKVAHICGATFTISENILSWYNPEEV